MVTKTVQREQITNNQNHFLKVFVPVSVSNSALRATAEMRFDQAQNPCGEHRSSLELPLSTSDEHSPFIVDTKHMH